MMGAPGSPDHADELADEREKLLAHLGIAIGRVHGAASAQTATAATHAALGEALAALIQARLAVLDLPRRAT
jgi:hypothetical protein